MLKFRIMNSEKGSIILTILEWMNETEKKIRMSYNNVCKYINNIQVINYK